MVKTGAKVRFFCKISVFSLLFMRLEAKKMAGYLISPKTTYFVPKCFKNCTMWEFFTLFYCYSTWIVVF